MGRGEVGCGRSRSRWTRTAVLKVECARLASLGATCRFTVERLLPGARTTALYHLPPSGAPAGGDGAAAAMPAQVLQLAGAAMLYAPCSPLGADGRRVLRRRLLLMLPLVAWQEVLLDVHGAPRHKQGVRLAPWLQWGALRGFDSALAAHALQPALRKHWVCPGCSTKLIGGWVAAPWHAGEPGSLVVPLACPRRGEVARAQGARRLTRVRLRCPCALLGSDVRGGPGALGFVRQGQWPATRGAHGARWRVAGLVVQPVEWPSALWGESTHLNHVLGVQVLEVQGYGAAPSAAGATEGAAQDGDGVAGSSEAAGALQADGVMRFLRHAQDVGAVRWSRRVPALSRPEQPQQEAWREEEQQRTHPPGQAGWGDSRGQRVADDYGPASHRQGQDDSVERGGAAMSAQADGRGGRELEDGASGVKRLFDCGNCGLSARLTPVEILMHKRTCARKD